MALFNDGSPSTTEDLRAYESSILDVASGEGIDLTVKLALAHRELGLEMLRFLVAQTAQNNQPPTVTRKEVVLTDPLFHWHTLRTLALTFRDAHHNELNDRFFAKWQEYEKQSTAAGDRLFEIGIGLVSAPVAKAKVPIVSPVAGVMTPGIFEIRVTWQNAQGQEGSLSERIVFTTQDGGVPAVISPMEPTDGVAWNVYAGPLGGPVTKQNLTAIPRGDSWTGLPTGFIEGAPAGNGQQPETFLRKARTR